MLPSPDDRVLGGKYRLLRKLGQGGMGSVWHAQHLTLQSPVAVKLISEEIANNPEALARFQREAQAAASLRSPHVVQILDHGVDAGVPYIVMELLEGESLANRLARARSLSFPETVRIMTDVARAMARAHAAKIVHRDLKPDNIFLVRNDEEGEVAKVLDFGIAKGMAGLEVAAISATRTGALMGTPFYMSPEQVEGAKVIDQRTDVWAFGVITFECLLGCRPFAADMIGSLFLAICARPMPVPSQTGMVPAGFDAWFARACSRELNERFASIKDAATELRRIENATSPSAPGYANQPLEPSSRNARTMSIAQLDRPLSLQLDTGAKRSRHILLAIVVLVAMAVAAVVLLGGRSPQVERQVLSQSSASTDSPVLVPTAEVRPLSPPEPEQPVGKAPELGVPSVKKSGHDPMLARPSKARQEPRPAATTPAAPSHVKSGEPQIDLGI